MSLLELDIKALCLSRSAAAPPTATPQRHANHAVAERVAAGQPSSGPPQAVVDGPRNAKPVEHPEANPVDAKIMVVDDEPLNVKVTQKHLRRAGYEKFVSTNDSREAVTLIEDERPDVVLLDIMMPHVNGLEILEAVRANSDRRHLPILMLTAATDEETKLTALELGATDILSKPVGAAELVLRVRNALIVKAHRDNLAEYSQRLTEEVRLRTTELEQSREEVIHVLACAAESRDQETGDHVLRVSRYAEMVARKLGIDEDQAELIGQAALLHDVGKIGIPDAILLKPGKLDEEEMAAMRMHCEYGFNILKGMPAHGLTDTTGPASPWRVAQSPVLNLAALIAMTHHEKWDGSGYPQGLSGASIPLEGRIMAVVDVFDALQSRRPYKEALPRDRCLEILEEGRGAHFDPEVLDAFLSQIMQCDVQPPSESLQ